MHKSIATLGLASILALGVSHGVLAAGEKVALLTPYLAAVATAEMVDSFKAEATEKMQWTVDVVDTAGDMGAREPRRGRDPSEANAIVLFSVDPAQIQAQVDAAKAAGIPVRHHRRRQERLDRAQRHLGQLRARQDDDRVPVLGDRRRTARSSASSTRPIPASASARSRSTMR